MKINTGPQRKCDPAIRGTYAPVANLCVTVTATPPRDSAVVEEGHHQGPSHFDAAEIRLVAKIV
jgi:hypothetical protein